MGWGWGFSAEASVFGVQGEAFRFQELRGADGPKGFEGFEVCFAWGFQSFVVG